MKLLRWKVKDAGNPPKPFSKKMFRMSEYIFLRVIEPEEDEDEKGFAEVFYLSDQDEEKDFNEVTSFCMNLDKVPKGCRKVDKKTFRQVALCGKED